MNYSTHRYAGDEESKAAVIRWQEQEPDVLFMHPRIDQMTLKEYIDPFTGESVKQSK